ncbi:MAG TPA: D-cysteine desulfhydrase family protein [Aggregatilineaceae bacterium]|nr:D-cysteine desulfhydrase family protein [Aggregatilineaceae bacterium]
MRLAHLPTPIEPLPNLSRFLGGPDLFIKRDDQTGLATGGNKARKLEFLLAQALQAGADSVITAGAAQSNHARQTAAGAARCGLDCHLVLRAPDGGPPRDLTGNLLLDHVLGASIHWTAERAPYAQALAQVEAELHTAGKRPYVVPYGGSNPFGLMGYVVAMREYAAQARGLKPFGAHVFATSSGGTQSGMLLGAHLAGLPDAIPILGISVDKPAAQLVPEVVALANGGADLLGLNWRLDPSAVAVNDGYIGGGYAVVGDPEREAIRLLARHEGILADPVYTGRALAGLIDLIHRGEIATRQRVLFWHTGGAAALFALAHELHLGEPV